MRRWRMSHAPTTRALAGSTREQPGARRRRRRRSGQHIRGLGRGLRARPCRKAYAPGSPVSTCTAAARLLFQPSDMRDRGGVRSGLRGAARLQWRAFKYGASRPKQRTVVRDTRAYRTSMASPCRETTRRHRRRLFRGLQRLEAQRFWAKRPHLSGAPAALLCLTGFRATHELSLDCLPHAFARAALVE